MLRETRTENGRVRGIVATDARITVYKGIPFGADTSGKNRWRPPQPAEDWEGVRECYEFGEISMQRVPGRAEAAFRKGTRMRWNLTASVSRHAALFWYR